MPVPNQFPSIPNSSCRLAIIGEAPGKDEAFTGMPFVGQSGKFLNDLLSMSNILRDNCFVGNVCQIQPPDNVIARFDWDGPEIQSGVQQLITDLNQFKPTLVLTLGGTPLHLFKAGNINVKKKRVDGDYRFAFPNSIDDWRGSRFMSVTIEDHSLGSDCLLPIKTLASYHPAYCLRAYENTVLLSLDLKRATKEVKFPELILPKRTIISQPTYAQATEFLNGLLLSPRPVSVDIEGYYHHISCISFATAPDYSIVIPFSRRDGSSYWTIEEEMTLLRLIADVLRCVRIHKIWQNGLYDRFALQYGYSIVTYGNSDDTMLKWWEKYCELPKNLGVQASILTDEPFYKSDIKSQDDDTFYRYCGKDSAITYELNTKLQALVASHAPTAMAHYRHNHNLLNLFLYIELRGFRYDIQKAKQTKEEIQVYLYRQQTKLDALTFHGQLPATSEEREALVRLRCGWVKHPDRPKAKFVKVFDTLLNTARKESLTETDIGFLCDELDLSLNTKSEKFKDYLYRTLKLPIQYNKDSGAETTDYLALQRLSKQFPSQVLELAIDIGQCRTRSQYLDLKADSDGRVRSSYNLVGTDTGRITSSTSVTGSGTNLQTIADDDKSKPTDHPLRYGQRRLFIADLDHYLFQCDLKGSDGWTIGAHLNSLGDSTMLDDLRSGIKPASRIAYMLRHGVNSLKGKRRDEIKHLVEEVKKTDWDYFACKVGIWGICYLMGPDTLSDNIFEESEGKVLLTRKQVTEFRTAVFEGYRVKLWHDATSRRLATKPMLTSASGHCRRFYGRPREVLGKALADEPQQNTTYATNRAAERMWMDPENRIQRVIIDNRGQMLTIPFRAEPLHQVHDALIGQFHKDDVAWALPKIREWFNNPLIIAGQTITIPFEGNYGLSWGDLSVGTI